MSCKHAEELTPPVVKITLVTCVAPRSCVVDVEVAELGAHGVRSVARTLTQVRVAVPHFNILQQETNRLCFSFDAHAKYIRCFLVQIHQVGKG